MSGPSDNGSVYDDDGITMVQLDPAKSWIEMKVAVLLAADGSSLREAEAPRTRHNFMTLSAQ